MRFIWFLVAKYRLKKNKEDKTCIREKFGFANNDALKKLEEYKRYCQSKKLEEKVIVIHAVSVGESLSVLSFVKKLLEKNFFVVFTTTTITSANLIKQKLTKNFIHQYSVFPCKVFIERFYNYWHPSKIFFVESEIYPSMISFFKKKNCEIYLINARMSKKTYKKWNLVKFYISNILSKYNCIITQSQEESNKFQKLSNGKAKIECFGNLKLESSIDFAKNIKDNFKNNADSSVVSKCKLLQNSANGRKIIVFASIHESEFFHLIWQYTLMLKQIKCIGVFVPRHLDKVKNLEKEFEKNEINTTLFSEFCGGEFNNTIIVDQFGILNYIYNISDYSIVCGSFTDNIGGHNPLESITLEKPTLIGNYCYKNQKIVDDLLTNNAIIQTSDVSTEIFKLVKNKTLEENLINNAKIFLSNNYNIADKIITFLDL